MVKIKNLQNSIGNFLGAHYTMVKIKNLQNSIGNFLGAHYTIVKIKNLQNSIGNFLGAHYTMVKRKNLQNSIGNFLGAHYTMVKRKNLQNSIGNFLGAHYTMVKIKNLQHSIGNFFTVVQGFGSSEGLLKVQEREFGSQGFEPHHAVVLVGKLTSSNLLVLLSSSTESHWSSESFLTEAQCAPGCGHADPVIGLTSLVIISKLEGPGILCAEALY